MSVEMSGDVSLDESIESAGKAIEETIENAKDMKKYLKNKVADKKDKAIKFMKDYVSSTAKQEVDSIDIFWTAGLFAFIAICFGTTFGVFNWYFLYNVCSPKTMQIQPFWTEEVYTSAFYNPAAGVYPCQSFFEASIEDCAKISSLTKEPSMPPSPAPEPTRQPVSVADDSPKFCLVPCTLPGIPCEKYASFNQAACDSAYATNLGTFYGNFTSFSCSSAGSISCIAQKDGDISFNKVPSQITTVYLTCTTVAQSFTNSVQYMTYCHIGVAFIVAVLLLGRRKGWQTLLKREAWVALFFTFFGDKLKEEIETLEDTVKSDIQSALHS